MISSLKAEIELLKDLDHPNIVLYLGMEQTPEFLSIFLEYVPGGSIGRIIRTHGKVRLPRSHSPPLRHSFGSFSDPRAEQSSQFEENVIKFFTLQILDGLEYLHSLGILHRDMKADNILIDQDGMCKISDFGTSKKSGDIYQNNENMSMQGSIFWMAPEGAPSSLSLRALPRLTPPSATLSHACSHPQQQAGLLGQSRHLVPRMHLHRNARRLAPVGRRGLHERHVQGPSQLARTSLPRTHLLTCPRHAAWCRAHAPAPPSRRADFGPRRAVRRRLPPDVRRCPILSPRPDYRADMLSHHGSEPEARPTASEAKRDPFLASLDPTWSFTQTSLYARVSRRTLSFTESSELTSPFHRSIMAADEMSRTHKPSTPSTLAG